MANYNTGLKYNYTGDTGGFKYNSSQFFILVKIFETIHSSDDVRNLVVQNILRESVSIEDIVVNYALFQTKESFSFEDMAKQSLLLKIAEKFGVADKASDLIVKLYLEDKIEMLDKLKKLEVLLSQEENLIIGDKINFEILFKFAEQLGLSDLAKSLVEFKEYEYVKLTDRKPRKAISDFLIGYMDNLDQAWEYVMPLEMKFDPNASSVQVMPSSKSTYIEMPYVDGNQWENTVYENRLFDIVCWSADGLTTAQKEQLKLDITRFLDSTKNKTQKLTLQKSNIAFDVKYTGSANIREAPSFIQARLPLESQPYGYPLFDQIIYGNGLIVNHGDKEAGIINKISAGCTNPSFQIGTIRYTWNGTVPINAELIIDHENLLCYTQDYNGDKKQAIDKLVGDFQSVPVNSTMQITANENTKDYLTTTIKEHILWGEA